MKKGFTLIELLAVIVILAIIALIATPIVLNIINDTKESARLRSADFYLDAVEYSISKRILDGKTIEDGVYNILESGNICIGTLEDNKCNGDILEVEVDGEIPNGDKITIKEGQIVSHVIKYGDVVIKNEEEVEEVVVPGATFSGYLDEDLNWIDLGGEEITLTWEELKDTANGEKYGYDATKITDTTIGESVNFTDSCTMNSIIFPSTIVTIESYAMRYMYLESIDFSNCINLETIGREAFVGSFLFKSVDLGKCTKLTRIEHSAFESNSLTNITLPNSVEYIGEYVFRYTPLTNIDFRGTKEEWNAITFDPKWNADNDDKSSNGNNITVTCTDGTITIPAYQ